MLRFEWDDQESLTNKEKHGVSFELAAEVFGDPRAVSRLDDRMIASIMEKTGGSQWGRCVGLSSWWLSIRFEIPTETMLFG